jgi:ferredoxin-type protein NapH
MMAAVRKAMEHRWLVSRRFMQLGTLALFAAGPATGLWWVKGTLAASTWFDAVLLVDPFVLAQCLAAGHIPGAVALWGALSVLLCYAMLGGRAYCAWICPVNLLTDGAAWLRERLGIAGGWRLHAGLRRWLLGTSLVLPALLGMIAWEAVNPVTLLHRALFFGAGLGWYVVAAVFLFDLFISPRGWCGRVCPVGAFYGIVGRFSVTRVVAAKPDACTRCGKCLRRCPEPHVIAAVLKPPCNVPGVILSGDCSNCGRCIDVCEPGVFRFGSRFENRGPRDRG